MSAPGAKVRIRQPIRYFGRWRPGDEIPADTEDGLGLVTMFPDRVEVVREVPDYLAVDPLPERMMI